MTRAQFQRFPKMELCVKKCEVNVAAQQVMGGDSHAELN